MGQVKTPKSHVCISKHVIDVLIVYLFTFVSFISMYYFFKWAWENRYELNQTSVSMQENINDKH